MHPTQAGTGLVRMGESHFVPQYLGDDVRGKDVYDAGGQHVGSVEDLYIDRQEREVRFLEVGAGGFLGIGHKRFLVPVEAVVEVAEGGWPSRWAGRRRWKVPPPSTPGSRPRPPPKTGAPKTTPALPTAMPVTPQSPERLPAPRSRTTTGHSSRAVTHASHS